MYAPIFDEHFYREANGLGADGTLEHFIAHGDRAGFDPSPYFSTSYYRMRYPDWQVSGALTTVEDFLRRLDAGDVRQPHPLIDPAYYAARYPDLEKLGPKSILHFSRIGDREARSPSAGFDADFYQRCYLRLEQESPFRHFIAEGRKAGNQPMPQSRSQEDSKAYVHALTASLDRPLLLIAHDAQPAGVPLLTLELATTAAARGWQPVFALNWGGPLIERFRALGPVVLMAEGWDPAGLIAGLPPHSPVLINTAAAAGMASGLANAGHRCLVLLHEMGDYIRSQNFLPDLLAAQAEGADIIASMPRMAAGLKDELGELEVIRPGITLPPTPLPAFRRARQMTRHREAPVFIGAGHADHRKGFDLFLEAAALLTARRPGSRFIWLGALDGWSRGLAREAMEKGLDLVLPGFVSDSLAWYRAADAYLLTSRQDPGPTTLIHAAAVGTPFVGYAFDIGLRDHTEGIGQFIEPGNAPAFADAALAAASSVTSQSRRILRRYIRNEAGFQVYADTLLRKFTRLRLVG